MKAPLPADEGARLAALREYRILDTPPEAAYDDITRLAAHLCAAPIALITVVDRDRLWFKSRVGLEAVATPRDAAFCAHAILSPDDVLVVPDARADPRFADNPMVTAAPGIRFYAGVPLVTRDGHALGTLCVFDRVPRTLEPEQAAALRALRRQVVNELELQRYAAEQAETRAGLESARILERVSDAFVTLDRDWRYTCINAKAGQILGRRPEDLLGKHIWAESPEGVGQPFHKACGRAMETQQPITIEEFSEPFQRWLENRIYPSPEGLSIYFSDVTERKRAEQELRDKAAALQEIARHLEEAQAIARVGSWELDPATDRSLWSAEMYRLFGRDPAAGPPTVDEFMELVHPDDRAAIHVAAPHAQAGGPVPVGFRTNPAHGPVRHLESTGVSRDGSIALEGTTQDVTERVRLIERERRARELAETLSEANLALTQKVDLETVLEAILDHLARLVPYDSANVMLLEEGRRLAVRAARGYERLADASRTRRVVFEVGTKPLLEAILMAGAPVLVRDSLEEPTWQRVAGTEHVRNWLGIPLVQQGQVLGLFSVDKTEPGFFTDEHVRLAQALAPAAATAIANASLVADLREQEARLQLAIEASNLGPWDWDLRTNTVHFSAEWKRQIGYEEHEIQDRYEEWESRLHPEDRESTLAALRAYMDGRRPDYEVEFRLRHKDGSYRWIYTRGQMLRGADGDPSRMLGCHLDVTERKRIEVALRESEKRYRQIVETVGEGIWQIDGESRTTFVTQRMAEMLGYTVAEMDGASMFAFMDVEGQAIAAEHVERRARGIKEQHDFKFRRKDGQDLWAIVSADPIFDSAGRYAGALGLITDVTERKRAEGALRTLSRQLLGAHEEERRRIARELHDQIGQVLTAVKLNLQGVARQTTLEAALERVPRAIETVDQAIGQVRGLSLDLRPSLLDDLGLPAALRWYVDRRTRDAGIEGRVTADGVEARLPPEIEIACFRVAQEAVTNVLRHARAKSVWVELRRSGAELELCVCDDGAGFDPPEARARAASGACLGLSGMQERVSLAGGRLEITSAPGAGTQVVARFPASAWAVP